MFPFVAKFFDQADNVVANKVFSVAQRRNFSSHLVPAPDAADPRGDRLRGDPFMPEQSYFSVRLVEMRMAEAGNYISKYLPMCSCFLRYRHGDTQRDVPYIVGYDMIRSLLGKDAPESTAQNIEFKNVYIVRDAPVKTDSVTMFTALCRLSNSTFTRGMLDLLADTAGTLGGPAVGLAVTTGANLAKRLGTILGADGVTTRFGIFDGDVLEKSGYRVFAGAGLDAAELEMSKGQLVRKNAEGVPTQIDDVDYLVIALEYRKTLLDQPFGALAHLPFHARWAEAVTKLIGKDLAGANDAVKQMLTELRASPDIVEADRFELLATYVAQLEKWSVAASGLPVFKSGGKTMSASLKDVATKLTKDKRPQVGGLVRIAADHVGKPGPKLSKPEVALTDDALSNTAKQLHADIEKANADSTTLSQATTQLMTKIYAMQF